MANLMKQTEERHSESRMRAIRTSGSMRESPSGGQWPSRLSSRLGLPTLLIPLVHIHQFYHGEYPAAHKMMPWVDDKTHESCRSQTS
jgi:hypothetical protein